MPSTASIQPLMLDLRAASVVLSIPYKTLRHAVLRADFPIKSFLFGGKRFIAVAAIEQFLRDVGALPGVQAVIELPAGRRGQALAARRGRPRKVTPAPAPSQDDMYMQQLEAEVAGRQEGGAA